MPELISCPKCEGKLRIRDEMLGKKIKCPKCQNLFVARVEEEPELDELDELEEIEEEPVRPRSRSRRDEDDEEDEDERPRKRRAREEEEDEEEEDEARPRKRKSRERGDWHTVYHGLFIIANAIRISIGGSIFCGIVEGVGARLAEATRSPLVLILFALPRFVLTLVCTVMWLIGLYRCMAASNKNGAKALAIASFSLDGAALLFSLPGLFLPILEQFSLLLYLANMVVFILFLRAVCLTMKNRGLARSALFLLATMGVSLVCIVLMVLIQAVTIRTAMQNQGRSIIMLLALPGLLGCLVGIIWYVIYIPKVCDAMERHLFPS